MKFILLGICFMARRNGLLSWFYKGRKLNPKKITAAIVITVAAITGAMYLQMSGLGFFGLSKVTSGLSGSAKNHWNVCLQSNGRAFCIDPYLSQSCMVVGSGDSLIPDLTCADFNALIAYPGDDNKLGQEFICPPESSKESCRALAKQSCQLHIQTSFLVGRDLGVKTGYNHLCAPSSSRPSPQQIGDLSFSGNVNCDADGKNCIASAGECSQTYGCFPACADYDKKKGTCACGDGVCDAGDPWYEDDPVGGCALDCSFGDDQETTCATQDTAGNCVDPDKGSITSSTQSTSGIANDMHADSFSDTTDDSSPWDSFTNIFADDSSTSDTLPEDLINPSGAPIPSSAAEANISDSDCADPAVLGKTILYANEGQEWAKDLLATCRSERGGEQFVQDLQDAERFIEDVTNTEVNIPAEYLGARARSTGGFSLFDWVAGWFE